jgi:hypothetical protein
MKVGEIYIGIKTGGIYIIPLTEPDIDGNIVYLGYKTSGDIDKYPVFNINKSITSPKEALAYVKGINVFQVFYGKVSDSDLVSTYVPTMEKPLSIGDKYFNNKTNKDYLTIGFIKREVSTDAVSASAPKQDRLYPIGVVIKPVVDYLSLIENTRQGIASILDSPNNIKATEKTNILNYIFDNMEMAYWSINMPKPSGIVFMKQEKPLPRIEPIKIQKPKKPVDSGDKIVAYSYFDEKSEITISRDSVREEYRNKFGISNILEAMPSGLMYQELNYTTFPMPVLPFTDNVLFDKLCIVRDESMLNRMSLGNMDLGAYASNRKSFAYIIKDKNSAQENFFIPNPNEVRTLLKFQFDGFDTLDYSTYYQYEGVAISRGDLWKEDIIIEKFMYGMPVIPYAGGGYFACFSIDDANNDNSYGIGDRFKIKNKSEELIILYSGLAINKKGEHVICHYVVEYQNLLNYIDKLPFTGQKIFCITDEYLKANIDKSTQKIYPQIRKIIKDAFLSVSPTTKTTTTGASQPATSPYQSIIDVLGEEYDATFLNTISALDWGRINELSKKNPEYIDIVRSLISESYALYLIEQELPEEEPVVKQETSRRKNQFTWRFRDNNLDVTTYETNVDGISQFISKDFVEQSFLFQNQTPTTSYEIGQESKIISQYADFREGNDLRLYLVSQLNNELPLNYEIYLLRSGESIKLKTVAFERWVNVDKLNTDEANYFTIGHGDAIMYYLFVMEVLNKNATNYFSEAQAKKIFPIKLTPRAIAFLKYANYMGAFQTPEKAFDNISNFKDASHAPVYEYISESFIQNLYASYSSSRAMDASTKISKLQSKAMDVEHSYRYRNMGEFKDEFVKTLKALPIDWGNTQTPLVYMGNTPISTATTPQPTKTRKTKIITPTPTPKYKDGFTWIDDKYEDIMVDELEEFKDKYDIKNPNLTIDQREFVSTKKGVSKNYLLVRFTPETEKMSRAYSDLTSEMAETEESYEDTSKFWSEYDELREMLADTSYDLLLLIPVDKIDDFNAKYDFKLIKPQSTASQGVMSSDDILVDWDSQASTPAIYNNFIVEVNETQGAGFDAEEILRNEYGVVMGVYQFQEQNTRDVIDLKAIIFEDIANNQTSKNTLQHISALIYAILDTMNKEGFNVWTDDFDKNYIGLYEWWDKYDTKVVLPFDTLQEFWSRFVEDFAKMLKLKRGTTQTTTTTPTAPIKQIDIDWSDSVLDMALFDKINNNLTPITFKVIYDDYDIDFQFRQFTDMDGNATDLREMIIKNNGNPNFATIANIATTTLQDMYSDYQSYVNDYLEPRYRDSSKHVIKMPNNDTLRICLPEDQLIMFFENLWVKLSAYLNIGTTPTTTTTTPATASIFKWDEDWYDWNDGSNTHSAYMVEEIKRNLDISISDFTIKRRVFTIETPNGIKKYFLFGFYPSNIPTTPQYEEYIKEMRHDASKYRTANLYYLYEPLKEIAESNDFDYTIIVPQEYVKEWSEKYVEDYVGNQVATPPATTTPKLTEIPSEWYEDLDVLEELNISDITTEAQLKDLLSKKRRTLEEKVQFVNLFYMFSALGSTNPHYQELVDSGLIKKGYTQYQARLYTPYNKSAFTVIGISGQDNLGVDNWIKVYIYPYLLDDINVNYFNKGKMQELLQTIMSVNGISSTTSTTTTTPTTTSNFKWVDTPWNNFLRESYLKSFIEYYGGSADGQIVTASFNANYPNVTDPKKAFFIVGFANAGAGKEYKELKLKLAKYANKVDGLALHDNYGNEFTDAVNNYQFEFDDLWFFDANDYLDIVDLLLYRGAGTTPPATPPTPPAPPAPEPPKTKTTKPKTTTTKEPKQPKQPKISKAKEIKNKLDELDLDDI